MKFQNHIGLDIGESTIKLIQLSRDGNAFKLHSIGIVETPQGDEQIMAAVKKLIAETGASGNQVVMSLPESQVYTRVIEMPFLEEPELSSTIKWQAEQYIPVPLSEVVLKHQILHLPETGVPDSKMTVLLVAAPNVLVQRYTQIATKIKLDPMAIETEIFAAARALVAVDDFEATSLIVNFGSTSTTLAALKKGDLTLTQAVPTGGEALTRALSGSLGLDAKQAEEYKKTYGMLSDKLEGKVFGVLKIIVDQVIGEVKKVVAYSATRPGGMEIKRVILCGGDALIPGLLPYFTSSLGLEVQLGNPFTKVSLNEKQKQVVYDAGPLFAAATGLAMKMT